MWGIAFITNPREWALGKHDVINDDNIVFGVWWFFGPIAITYYYE